MEPYNLVSLLGLAFFVGLAWVFSSNRKAINWKLVTVGITIQLALGLFVFVIPQGRELFWNINNLVVKLLSVSTKGAEFVFGPLAVPPGGQGSMGFFLAFQTLPSVIFFSALVSVLYFLKVMPFLIRIFAKIFTKTMGISGAESVAVASNIFVGVESALTIKPHLKAMTKSELCTLLTAGMATVASNVLAFYVFSLQEFFPAIAGHLVSASIISAPAAIVLSKIILPETETPETLGEDIHPQYEQDSNIFEAIIKGAQSGLSLIAGIIALLIAVLGLVALFDLGLSGIGSFVGLKAMGFELSLSNIFGYLFYPLTLAMGVPMVDAVAISRIIGERLVLTEFVAYMDLAKAIKEGAIHDPRSLVIASYALCGFAHFASLSIFIGGISALAPSKTKELSEVGLRALLAASLACLMTGSIAGTFYLEGSILFG
ncbi:MAG: nucleoside transporter C-terminal domain-containing protein [SAR324 cluster bacterium]|nr:nucleoside transporter C-terminal domain-containing protein [SAR324 cluster bacterium]